jgi:hypothetical protein
MVALARYPASPSGMLCNSGRTCSETILLHSSCLLQIYARRATSDHKLARSPFEGTSSIKSEISRMSSLVSARLLSTTTVDLPVGWLCEPEQADRQLLAGDNDCAEPACAWPAARATKPGAVPESGRVAATRLPTNGALLELLVRPGRVQAPFFRRRFAADGGEPGVRHH